MPRVRGLVRARTSGPGWTRRRAGRGFVYLDEDLAEAVASLLERRSPRARLLARREGRSWRPVRASELLGNTPAVAKSSYIDPAILDRFHANELIDLHRGDANAYLTLMRGGK